MCFKKKKSSPSLVFKSIKNISNISQEIRGLIRGIFSSRTDERVMHGSLELHMQSYREAWSVFYKERWEFGQMCYTVPQTACCFKLISNKWPEHNCSRKMTSYVHFVFRMHGLPKSASISFLLDNPIFLGLWCWQWPRAAQHYTQTLTWIYFPECMTNISLQLKPHQSIYFLRVLF